MNKEDFKKELMQNFTEIADLVKNEEDMTTYKNYMKVRAPKEITNLTADELDEWFAEWEAKRQ